MHKFQLRLLFITLILSLAGCASGYWVVLKNGHPADASEAKMDSLRCEREAATTYPFAQVIASSGGGSSGKSSTRCYGWGDTVTCDKTGGGYSNPQVTTSDGNAGLRDRYYISCMAALGYERKFIRDNDERGVSASPISSERSSTMECRTNADCGYGERCRSKKGGGTECRR